MSGRGGREGLLPLVRGEAHTETKPKALFSTLGPQFRVTGPAFDVALGHLPLPSRLQAHLIQAFTQKTLNRERGKAALGALRSVITDFPDHSPPSPNTGGKPLLQSREAAAARAAGPRVRASVVAEWQQGS